MRNVRRDLNAEAVILQQTNLQGFVLYVQVYTFFVNIASRTLAVILVGFLACGLFAYTGSFVEAHHTMGDGTSHHVCSLSGTTADCVSILEHLSHWQASFTATFVPATFLVLCVALCLCLVRIVKHAWAIALTVSRFARSLPYRYIYLPRHALAEAFSNGLIHPKLHSL